MHTSLLFIYVLYVLSWLFIYLFIAASYLSDGHHAVYLTVVCTLGYDVGWVGSEGVIFGRGVLVSGKKPSCDTN